jgi:hypothetical protein
VAVGTDGAATVVGNTGSTDFSVTPGAFDTSHNGGYDAFVTRLSPDGSALLYSTFLGGTDIDQANAVAIGADGAATVAGNTESADFPATTGAFDTSFNGGCCGGDAFVARVDVGGTPPPVALTAAPLNSPVPRGTKLRFTVTLTNLTDEPLTGDLVLDVEAPDGATYTSTVHDDGVLGPFNTATRRYGVPVWETAPLGTYEATVSALDGTGTVRATDGFTFEVVAGEVFASGAATTGEALGAVVVLDEASVEASAAPASATVVVSPNPFSSHAVAAFTLAAPGAVRLVVYDVLGREVAVLVDGEVEAGRHEAVLDGGALPAGVYVVRMEAGGAVQARRVTRVR